MSFKIIMYRKPNQGENKIPFQQKEILNGQRLGVHWSFAQPRAKRKKEGDSREERTKHCQTGCSNANSMEKVLFQFQDTQLETSLNDIYTSGSVLIQVFPNIFSIFFFAHCTFRLTPPPPFIRPNFSLIFLLRKLHKNTLSIFLTQSPR